MNFLRSILLITIFFSNSSQVSPPVPDSVYIPINDTLAIVDSSVYYREGADLYKKYHAELMAIKVKNSKEIDRQINRIKAKRLDTVFIIKDSSFNSVIQIIKPNAETEKAGIKKRKGFFRRIFNKKK